MMLGERGSPHITSLLQLALLVALGKPASVYSLRSKQKAGQMSCSSNEIFLKEFSKPPCRRKKHASMIYWKWSEMLWFRQPRKQTISQRKKDG
jgi:hypothetical protein